MDKKVGVVMGIHAHTHTNTHTHYYHKHMHISLHHSALSIPRAPPPPYTHMSVMRVCLPFLSLPSFCCWLVSQLSSKFHMDTWSGREVKG